MSLSTPPLTSHACSPDASADPINGIRLANGTANSGRLEVRMPSYGWGTVRIGMHCNQASSSFEWEAFTGLSTLLP